MKNQAISRQKNEHTFKKVPDFLFTNPNYNHISNDAKLLYSLLLSRHSLSEKNKDTFSDERGIYIIFTRENIAIALNCSTKKVTRLMQQLCITGLVQEKQMGLNKPNRIYVQQNNTIKSTPRKQTDTVESAILHGHDTLSGQEPTKSEAHEPTKLPANKIDNNYIEHSYIIQSTDSLSIISTKPNSNLPEDKNERQLFDSFNIDTVKNKKNDEQVYLETLEQVKKQIEFDEHYADADEIIVKKIEGLMTIMIDV